MISQKTFVRILSLLLAILLMNPTGVVAATNEPAQPYASSYLDSYNAYVYPAGGGKVQVWFTVAGAGTMDELGCLLIRLYESTDNNNWTLKKVYTHDVYSGMLSYNDNYHSGHVNYQGVAGRYYRAYVCIWGGKNGDGDGRYFYTSSKKAT